MPSFTRRIRLPRRRRFWPDSPLLRVFLRILGVRL